ncbi:zf-TFIIB domain-containing protein [Ignavibacterium sp.]|uniref:TFIIB-type zinc ribbon-containing protein n=1 Tax=Ignavibacterium sp. TaxID=2651167 RepID=UPI00307FA585
MQLKSVVVYTSTSRITTTISNILLIDQEIFMPVKPSEKEEEYFARLEFDRRKKQEEEARIKLEEAEKERLKNLHFMHCPKCGMKLIEINYKDVQVDKCSSCDGVWLDAGELDAISKLEKGKLDKLFDVFKK